MANTMRWRYGDTNPVMLPVANDLAVEIGDLIYLDSSEAKPASSQADQGTASLNQSQIKTKFVGVAMQASPVGENAPIRIASSGVFEFVCDAATFELGELLGISENSAGDALEDQKLVGVSSVTNAVGRSAKQISASTTRVLIDIVSTVMRGGTQSAV